MYGTDFDSLLHGTLQGAGAAVREITFRFKFCACLSHWCVCFCVKPMF